jgi:hypothetical protein
MGWADYGPMVVADMGQSMLSFLVEAEKATGETSKFSIDLCRHGWNW